MFGKSLSEYVSFAKPILLLIMLAFGGPGVCSLAWAIRLKWLDRAAEIDASPKSYL